jgi:WD40 repeat protein
MRKFIWAILFLMLFQNQQAHAEETTEELKRRGFEIGLKFPQPSEILEQEQNKFFEILPLETISLTAPSYRVSCNSKYCAFSLKDGTIFAYDLETKRIAVQEKFSDSQIYSVAFHPFENIICFGGREGKITIFDLDKKDIIRNISELGTPVSDVKFSPDGTVLAVAYLGKGGISLHETKNYEKLQTMYPHEEGIYYISFSPDSDLIASGSRDRKISIAPVREKWPSQILDKHKSLILSLDFAKDNDFLASGGADCQLIVWQKKGNSIEEKPYFKWIHSDWVTAVKFFENYLITSSKDGKIRIFNFKDKKFLGIFKGSEPILSIDIAQDGNYLFTSSTDISIFDFKKIREKIK